MIPDLIASVAETSNTVPVTVVSSIVSAALGAVGGHFYKTARATQPDPQIFVTRAEFDEEIAALRQVVVEGERITQSKIDRLIERVSELKGIVSVTTTKDQP